MTTTPLTGLWINRGHTNSSHVVVVSKSEKMISHSVRQIVNMCLMFVFHCQVIYSFYALSHRIRACCHRMHPHKYAHRFLCSHVFWHLSILPITLCFILLALGQSCECCSANEEYRWSPLNIIKWEHSSTKNTTKKTMYGKVFNIRCTLWGNRIVWSLRCSWSIACWRCSKYIFILCLTLDFNRLRKDNCKMRWETFKFWDLVRLILQIWWCIFYGIFCTNPILL